MIAPRRWCAEFLSAIAPRGSGNGRRETAAMPPSPGGVEVIGGIECSTWNNSPPALASEMDEEDVNVGGRDARDAGGLADGGGLESD